MKKNVMTIDKVRIAIIYWICLVVLGPFVWFVVGLYHFTEPALDLRVGAIFSMIYSVITIILIAISITAWWVLAYNLIV